LGARPGCAGVLADVDEPARAGQPAAEAADVDVARGVRLGEPEVGLVQAAAVVEVEHRGLVDDRLRVGGCPERQPARRDAADGAGLDGERDEIQHVLLRGDRGDALRHPDAEVDDAVPAQVPGGPAGDDGPGVQRGAVATPGTGRGEDLTGVGRVVVLGERLRVVHGLGHDDGVDEDAGHAHHLR